MKIICVVGARPNFMKIAPIMRELEKTDIETILLHTGQHYDSNMSDGFFKDLSIRKPDYNLDIRGGSHSEQVSKIMLEFEKVCLVEKPNLVLVVGDVNSTFACSLVAVKLGIKVAHVEAGLRSFDKSMPEEINRILTDRISDYLFVTEREGIENLEREGTDKNRIFLVGNTMIDSLLFMIEKIKSCDYFRSLRLEEDYAVLTLHRPSNVDSKNNLEKIINLLKKVSERIHLVFSIHPRTEQNLKSFGLYEELGSIKNMTIIGPASYIEFMNLVFNSKLVLTDSGGIQEETTFMGIPCITIRKNTERPITIKEGTNVLVGDDEKKLIEELEKALMNPRKGNKIEFWDGRAAERIVRILKDEYNTNK
jgi:UDP-N-acetylglucosamine 2-epimerase (non-hydrolysing)